MYSINILHRKDINKVPEILRDLTTSILSSKSLNVSILFGINFHQIYRNFETSHLSSLICLIFQFQNYRQNFCCQNIKIKIFYTFYRKTDNNAAVIQYV